MRVAQQLVAEVVVALVDVVERVEDRRRRPSSLDRRLELLERPIDHAGHDVRAEAATDDRAGASDGLGVIGDSAAEPGEHGVADRVAGRARRGSGRPSGWALVVEGREQLLDVERDPVRPLVDRPRRHRAAPAARRRGSASSRSRSPRASAAAAATSSAMPLAQQSRPPLAVDRVDAGTRQRDSRREQEQRAGPCPWRGELADDLEAHLVGPVEVVEGRAASAGRSPRGSDRRPIGRSAARAPRASPSCRPSIARRSSDSVPQVGIAAHPGRHLADRGERDLAVLGRDRPAVDPEPGRLGLARRAPGSGASCRARRAPGQEQASGRGPGRPRRSGDPSSVEQVVATDE